MKYKTNYYFYNISLYTLYKKFVSQFYYISLKNLYITSLSKTILYTL